MSARRFVDTNILIYAQDRSTGAKHEKARLLMDELWNSGEGVISTQVLQEFSSNVRRKSARPPSGEELRQAIEDFLTWPVVVNSPASTLRALENEERFQVSFWDGLILQAAEAAGADVLYTEDFSDGRLYGTVRAVNPFK
jgi:predicted nucleic acid-binding protein